MVETDGIVTVTVKQITWLIRENGEGTGRSLFTGIRYSDVIVI